MPHPKVVVVMPAYNAARTLRLTYEELPKDRVNLVILVDDGSTDETLADRAGSSGSRSSSTIETTATAPTRRPATRRRCARVPTSS